MDPLLLKGLLLGAVAVSSAVLGLFFLRFWKVTRDQLFVMFACAFGLDAVSRILTAVIAPASDDHPLLYGLRVFAYGCIIVGVVRKNYSRATPL
jgi:uncharacterized membrane protein HdeD (DUF308 family)